MQPAVLEKSEDGGNSSEKENSGSKQGNKFLRPTSLPLKPGTFTPKKVMPSPILPLVSPETPRPKKSYGQLYLNGHAYTYLGLKCSTRSFYCTLNKLQPTYVPLPPDSSKVSMYSNWAVSLTRFSSPKNSPNKIPPFFLTDDNLISLWILVLDSA